MKNVDVLYDDVLMSDIYYDFWLITVNRKYNQRLNYFNGLIFDMSIFEFEIQKKALNYVRKY